MTEATLVQLITAVIVAISGAFQFWVSAKYREIGRKVEEVKDNTNTVIRQNTAQSVQLNDVQREVNGRLTEMIDTAVEAALNKGLLQGAINERLRVEIEHRARIVAEKLEAEKALLKEKVAREEKGRR